MGYYTVRLALIGLVMSEFKVGDLITSKNFPSSLYEIIGIDDNLKKYFVKIIVTWDGTLVLTKSPLDLYGTYESTLYSTYESAIVPTFETMLQYEKLKREQNNN